MDLRITIKDEDDLVLDHIVIYQDGSDSEGTARIREMLKKEFAVEADPDADEFECMQCHKTFDNDDSIRVDGELYCVQCVEGERV